MDIDSHRSTIYDRPTRRPDMISRHRVLHTYIGRLYTVRHAGLAVV